VSDGSARADVAPDADDADDAGGDPDPSQDVIATAAAARTARIARFHERSAEVDLIVALLAIGRRAPGRATHHALADEVEIRSVRVHHLAAPRLLTRAIDR
jgi:hypothetical protein